jgi:hypothetical protein
MEEAAAWFERSRLRYTHALFVLLLVEAYQLQGEHARARALAEATLVETQEMGYRHLEGVALRLLGIALASEDPAAAAAHLGAAERLLEEVGAKNELGKTLAAHARLLEAHGDLAVARAHRERATAIFSSLGTRHIFVGAAAPDGPVSA